jgi:hypothetical protein
MFWYLKDGYDRYTGCKRVHKLPGCPFSIHLRHYLIFKQLLIYSYPVDGPFRAIIAIKP